MVKKFPPVWQHDDMEDEDPVIKRIREANADLVRKRIAEDMQLRMAPHMAYVPGLRVAVAAYREMSPEAFDTTLGMKEAASKLKPVDISGGPVIDSTCVEVTETKQLGGPSGEGK